MNNKHYDVLIVGGGISGASIYYELAKYTDVKSICMLEKYEALATLNTRGGANSQTVHIGDIETNYTLEKAKVTKRTAKMVEKFCLQYDLQDKIMFKHQKMALGVGNKEVDFITNRYHEFKELFPYLELWGVEELKIKEPKLVYTDKEQTKVREEPIVAMGTDTQYTTVDFGRMSEELVKEANKIDEDVVTETFFNSQVEDIIQKEDKTFEVVCTNGSKYTANFVVVNAGAHSLFLAHKMGYGKHMGCLPVAGSFYITNDEFLNGKVYMVQNNKLPFAALHGDPDILMDGKTRFGPTALVLPKLERYKPGTYLDFFKTLNFDFHIVKIFWDLLKDSDIRNYLLKNFTYEIPYINKSLFVKAARKIVPSLSVDDLTYANGFGGVRPQVLDKEKEKLMLGEASINPGTGVIFNMTPSPGATSCLGNAERDLRVIAKHLNLNFDEKQFLEDLIE
ncbi:MAG: FAD-dependent oxidoreductase [Campylobacterota bacterium]|nr:FAD-dependent oxidoreductase [Campylobacterota bacterium]